MKQGGSEVGDRRRSGISSEINSEINASCEHTMTEPTVGEDGQRDAGPGTLPGEAGVTLIELMIAMVLLAFGLLAVAGMAGAVATQTRMGGNVFGQTSAAQDVIEEFQTKGFGHTDLADGSSGTRQVTVSSHTYTVSYEVTQVGPDLKEVVVVAEATRELPADTLRTLVARMSGPAPLP